MTVERFEDLNSWKKAQELGVLIYQSFNELLDFSFRNQICKAAVSVSNNIAEGFDRGSNKDFIRFLYIARGSNSEVKSMLYLAKNLNYIKEIPLDKGLNLCEEVGKMLNSFISYLNKRDNQPTNATNATKT